MVAMDHLINILLSLLMGTIVNLYVSVFKFSRLRQIRINWWEAIMIQLLIIFIYSWLFYKYEFTQQYFLLILLFTNLTAISVADYKYKQIPNLLIAIGIISGGGLLILYGDPQVIWHIISAIIMGGFFALISVITKGALGMGDAKLISLVGLYLGMIGALAVIFVAIFLAGLLGLIILTFKIKDRKSTMPFAPFIFASIVVYIIMSYNPG